MKKIILVSFIFLLAGCAETRFLNNDEVISEMKKCEEAGYKPIQIAQHGFNGWQGIVRVECSTEKITQD